MKRKDFLRLSLLGGLGSALAAGGPRAAAGSGPAGNSFRFVHLTDIHLYAESRGMEGLLKAVGAVNSLDPVPDFVITGGDLVGDALAAGYEDAVKQFDLYQSCISRLGMPVYHTIGNHDIFGWYPWSGVSPDHPEFGKQMFRKRLGGGRSWRSFDHKGWHFILFDSMEPDEWKTGYCGRVSREQLVWLKQDLDSLDKTTPIAAVTHIPFVSGIEQFRSGGDAAWSEGGAVMNSDEVLRVFQGYNLKLVLQGHIHREEELRVEKIRFIMSGAVSGAWWRGPNVNTQEGFGVVDVSGDNFSFSYLDYGWETEK
ncbi:MAG: metallophosphoesterase [Candidatus Glassbacteria bacterium]|nr:metallophosphoesterase [Candidatus Glassbacteria bacterium]